MLPLNHNYLPLVVWVSRLFTTDRLARDGHIASREIFKIARCGQWKRTPVGPETLPDPSESVFCILYSVICILYSVFQPPSVRDHSSLAIDSWQDTDRCYRHSNPLSLHLRSLKAVSWCLRGRGWVWRWTLVGIRGEATVCSCLASSAGSPPGDFDRLTLEM